MAYAGTPESSIPEETTGNNQHRTDNRNYPHEPKQNQASHYAKHLDPRIPRRLKRWPVPVEPALPKRYQGQIDHGEHEQLKSRGELCQFNQRHRGDQDKKKHASQGNGANRRVRVGIDPAQGSGSQAIACHRKRINATTQANRRWPSI